VVTTVMVEDEPLTPRQGVPPGFDDAPAGAFENGPALRPPEPNESGDRRYPAAPGCATEPGDGPESRISAVPGEDGEPSGSAVLGGPAVPHPSGLPILSSLPSRGPGVGMVILVILTWWLLSGWSTG